MKKKYKEILSYKYRPILKSWYGDKLLYGFSHNIVNTRQPRDDILTETSSKASLSQESSVLSDSCQRTDCSNLA